MPGSLAELIEFNKRNADLVLSRFGQEIFEQAEATSGDLADPELPGARGARRPGWRAPRSSAAGQHGLDAVVALTANPACLTDYVLGDHYVFHTRARPR